MSETAQVELRSGGVEDPADEWVMVRAMEPSAATDSTGEGRTLNLKAKFEGETSYPGFKRVVLGGFNVGVIGSTCTALPRACC